MFIERKQDLSIYYFLSSLFSDVDYVKIRDGFPIENLTLPTISIEADSIDTAPFELGNHNRIQERLYFIDVFAKNKSQRDEYAYRILNALNECIPVYDYDEGFPPDVSPTRIGCLYIDFIKMKVLRIFPETVDVLYYRAIVSFKTTYSES